MEIKNQNFHVAIIMDGNRRWAKKRLLPTFEGHRRGAQKLQEILELSPHLGITHLTVYAFSSENWQRPENEISDLMTLLREYLNKEIDKLTQNNIKLNVIGNFSKLSPDIIIGIERAIAKTSHCNGLNLTIAISYGGHEEIIEASKKIAQEVAKRTLKIEQITEGLFTQYLYYPSLPQVDFFIRTSGEQRISNFLLWQISYAELYFTNTLWPDLTKEEFQDIIKQFRLRERRFGKRLNDYE